MFWALFICDTFSLVFSDSESFDAMSKYWSAYPPSSAIPRAWWLLHVCSLMRCVVRALRGQILLLLKFIGIIISALTEVGLNPLSFASSRDVPRCPIWQPSFYCLTHLSSALYSG